MKLTEMTLSEQLRISEREIRRRLELLGIGEKEKEELLALKPLIAPGVDALAERFYAQQVETEEIASLIGDLETLNRLKKHLCRYLLTLFDGEYGMEYVLSRLRIGMVHKRIGVPPKLYIPSFRNLLYLLREELLAAKGESRDRHRSIETLEKLMFFDLELVFDTYIYSLMEELARGKKELEEYAESLELVVAQRTEELKRLASRDGLTSLLNQRSFYEELKREIARTLRTGSAIALLYLDLDGFKAVNDTQGHRRGDEILVAVAELIRRVVREEDIAARYGGDEFCIILPHSGLPQAQGVAARLIEGFGRCPRLVGSGVSFSIGIAAAQGEELRDSDQLVRLADAAMYEAKKEKGHVVRVAESGCASA